jgi:hypothetical protein
MQKNVVLRPRKNCAAQHKINFSSVFSAFYLTAVSTQPNHDLPKRFELK